MDGRLPVRDTSAEVGNKSSKGGIILLPSHSSEIPLEPLINLPETLHKAF